MFAAFNNFYTAFGEEYHHKNKICVCMFCVWMYNFKKHVDTVLTQGAMHTCYICCSIRGFMN